MKEFLTDVEVNQVSALIREAGKALMSYWPGSTSSAINLGVQTKEDGSPVSAADLASNEILTLGISKIFPGDQIISEEVPYSPATEATRRVWIIDPLDGTKSFIAGRDDFSVLVGLCEEERIIAGFMFFPARGTFSWSVGDRGEPKHLIVSANTSIGNGLLYVAKMPDFARVELKCPHIDSGLAFQKVASGELDGLIIRMDTHREWDIAAPTALVTRAGGLVTNERGEEIKFGRNSKPCEYCIASNRKVHAEILELIP